ncbi:nitrous oxide reductase accessory protein NosL [Flavisolibacter tropicus]|uniref:nitrous oxide reductase accessory protein NosL n=1 Tax=Flavisolibacter tropicus TaxID=1492898 RepID=UPI000A741227|nr:nitrous oxide reductase accessory protein NosL [Flavisolibacter tropicus]
MSITSRIIVAIAALSLIATYFLPFWFIHLIAPQYPEGLTMEIWLNKLSGQVEIINGLNHYIGMAKVNEDMFPELNYLVYIIGAYILLGLIVALVGKRKLLLAYLVLTVIGGVAAMVDMYQWGYKYGHNLDPTAPIQVPGLSYQPPLVGHKKLLNFDAYSYPDTGGWVLVSAVVVFFIVWLVEQRRARKIIPKKTAWATPLTILSVFLFQGCSVEPEKIAYGKDQCNECRMTIMDPKFGSEVVTKKGKVYKFDDAHCIVQFLKAGNEKRENIAQIVFMDYQDQGRFLNSNKVWFIKSAQLKSPMNGNAAAFADKKTAETQAVTLKGDILNWEHLYNTL